MGRLPSSTFAQAGAFGVRNTDSRVAKRICLTAYSGDSSAGRQTDRAPVRFPSSERRGGGRLRAV